MSLLFTEKETKSKSKTEQKYKQKHKQKQKQKQKQKDYFLQGLKQTKAEFNLNLAFPGKYKQRIWPELT